MHGMGGNPASGVLLLDTKPRSFRQFHCYVGPSEGVYL